MENKQTIVVRSISEDAVETSAVILRWLVINSMPKKEKNESEYSNI